ncbi:MAG: DUF4176 domain-containing protein [Lachnospirales bacterium]
MLPIGSVVVLKGGSKTLMIFGRKQISSINSKVWDYLACFYPEGSIGPEYCFLFNEEDIDEVKFMGYSDENNVKFEKQLLSAVNNTDETKGQ